MSKPILQEENVKMNASFSGKEEAIRETGKILAEKGYVEEAYIEAMLEREELTSTYMGNAVAIPHGTEDSKNLINESGLSIVQVPDGVDFGDGKMVKILIGIAGKENEHLEILQKIAVICSQEENITKMLDASDEQTLLSQFEEVN
ncbi:PTS mannitol transporter subunit IIA [Salibacterium salarium]|uniref:Mannitol-specific phosphotransferase enzyme IIA component n=1 Tax=Salibacterium salarium TaxID=284579 RepID=A0A428N493_9BACI|nr:PTS sugar transporter subunit IIA [Salibacterium salarium]RSL33087.1 PTS mannitol transporter subunit IIA [Salibacterium salarium]